MKIIHVLSLLHILKFATSINFLTCSNDPLFPTCATTDKMNTISRQDLMNKYMTYHPAPVSKFDIIQNPVGTFCETSYENCVTWMMTQNTLVLQFAYLGFINVIGSDRSVAINYGLDNCGGQPSGNPTLSPIQTPTQSPTIEPTQLDDHNCTTTISLPDGTNCCWFRQIQNRCESIVWKTQLCESTLRISGISQASIQWLIYSNKCLQGSTDTNPTCVNDYNSINLLISNCYTNGPHNLCDLPKEDVQKLFTLMVSMNLDVRLLYNFMKIKECYSSLNYGRFNNLNTSQILSRIININLTPLALIEEGSTIIYVSNPSKAIDVFKNDSLISQGVYISGSTIKQLPVVGISILACCVLMIKWLLF